jgi:hypothetical protein
MRLSSISSGKLQSKLRTVPLTVLLLVSAFLGFSSVVEPARATATGLVCIADQTVNPTNCPAEPANLTGDVGDIITVAVNIQGVSSLNGFDIAVQVDPTVLQPLNISLADSILGNNCYDYHSGCRFVLVRSTNSNTGVARLAMAVFSLGISGAGNLFEINYKVLSSSIGTSVIFTLGCTGESSVQDVCVTLANPNVLPVKVQTASFGLVTPDFSIAAWPSPRTLLGSSDSVVGSTANSTIVLFGTGGFAGSVDISITPLPVCPVSCPSWGLNPTSLELFSGSVASALLNFSIPPGTPSNNWTINVTATSGNISHSVLSTFKIVPPPRFSISANPTTLTLHRGRSGTFMLEVVEPDCPPWGAPARGCVGIHVSSITISPSIKKGPSLSQTACAGPDYFSDTYTLSCWLSVLTNSTTHPATYSVILSLTNMWVISTITLTVIAVPNANDPEIH